MKRKKLSEFDHLTLKFYHERELRVFLRLWTAVTRSNLVASFEEKMPSNQKLTLEYRVNNCKSQAVQRLKVYTEVKTRQ